MKKIILKTIIILYIFIPFINIKAIDTYSDNVVLYNINDEKIIYSKNSDEQIKIASLTKIMTTIVALENIENIQEKIQMPAEAYKNLDGYVLSGIKPNDIITYEDLIYGIMLPSGADCANAVALKISGNIDNFVELMNKKADDLNLKNTHFSNPIGMDENNYSTVNDIAILLKYALQNEEFYKIFTTKKYTTTTNITLESTLIEKSKPYNIDVTQILGSKTGFTDEAGNCLASIAKINNVKYLLVTAHANTNNSYHILDAVNIYDYYSKNYSYKKIINYDQEIEKIKIDDLLKKEYIIKSENDVYLYLNNNVEIDNLTYEYEGIKEITKENKKGDKLGVIKVNYNNDTIYTEDVLLNENITFYNIKSLIISIVIIFIVLIIIKKIKTK